MRTAMRRGWRREHDGDGPARRTLVQVRASALHDGPARRRRSCAASERERERQWDDQGERASKREGTYEGRPWRTTARGRMQAGENCCANSASSELEEGRALPRGREDRHPQVWRASTRAGLGARPSRAADDSDRRQAPCSMDQIVRACTMQRWSATVQVQKCGLYRPGAWKGPGHRSRQQRRPYGAVSGARKRS